LGRVYERLTRGTRVCHKSCRDPSGAQAFLLFFHPEEEEEAESTKNRTFLRQKNPKVSICSEWIGVRSSRRASSHPPSLSLLFFIILTRRRKLNLLCNYFAYLLLSFFLYRYLERNELRRSF
jgi:hypothetical protein